MPETDARTKTIVEPGERLEDLCALIRYYILYQVNFARSGHTTTALSAVELMAALFFGVLRQDLDDFDHPNNDRVLFSKGHATPLLYALYAVLDRLSEEELSGFRSVESPLEGHPTFRFRFTEAPTGSLGQGLSIGAGLAYSGKHLDGMTNRVFVLMGDGEFAEGQVWEAIAFASHYKLDNLVGILDMNRLGQTGETQYGWDGEKYKRRVEAFGWAARVVNGHDVREVQEAYRWAETTGKPTLIIGRTTKGKGVDFWEDKNGWHSQPIPVDKYEEAVHALGDVDHSLRTRLLSPERRTTSARAGKAVRDFAYAFDSVLSTKKAFGNALVRLAEKYPSLLVLDGDVQNSTHAIDFANAFPDRFIQCFIAEQNMVSFAEGLALRGWRPFIVTFAAFLTRAFDQFRMAALGNIPLLVDGSYAGASIGKDGPSNMGLEDLAMFRALQGSTILYPCDAISTERLVELMVSEGQGIVYMRSTREPLPLLYSMEESFVVGGSKTLRQSADDEVVIIGAGLTVHEALVAHNLLGEDGVRSRVMDCYSVKPLDEDGIRRAAAACRGKVLVVEDHWFEGGLGDAVLNAVSDEEGISVRKIAVRRTPVSGEPREVMKYVGIDAKTIREVVMDWCAS